MAMGMVARKMEKAIHLKVMLFPIPLIINSPPLLRNEVIRTGVSSTLFLL